MQNRVTIDPNRLDRHSIDSLLSYADSSIKMLPVLIVVLNLILTITSNALDTKCM